MHDLHDHPANRFGSKDQQPIPKVAGAYGRNERQTQDRRLLLVLMLVEDNLRRQLVIRDLAEAVNLSPGRLAHLFKIEIGISPQRYLNTIRLAKAAEYLESGGLSIKEIAAEVGFPNASRFCRSFRGRFGTTPKEYRKSNLRLDLSSIVSLRRSNPIPNGKSKQSLKKSHPTFRRGRHLASGAHVIGVVPLKSCLAS